MYRIFRSISRTRILGPSYAGLYVTLFNAPHPPRCNGTDAKWPLSSSSVVTGDHARMEDYTLEGEIRGHHVYKATWTPVIGQILDVQAESANRHDRYAVFTLHNGSVVGHLSREYSKLAWYFLQHNGQIKCQVTGARRISQDAGKGLVVPCVYMFTGKPAITKKLIKLFLNISS